MKGCTKTAKAMQAGEQRLSGRRAWLEKRGLGHNRSFGHHPLLPAHSVKVGRRGSERRKRYPAEDRDTPVSQLSSGRETPASKPSETAVATAHRAPAPRGQRKSRFLGAAVAAGLSEILQGTKSAFSLQREKPRLAGNANEVP